MTPASLSSYSHKDLAQMAKRGGVRGWHSMRKDQLVKALVASSKTKSPPQLKSQSSKKVSTTRRAAAAPPATASTNGSSSKSVRATASRNGTNGSAAAVSKSSPRVQRHLSKIREKLERYKNLASSNGKKERPSMKERIVVMVRDPFWLHAFWEIKRQSVERVQAAMSQEWHTARPFLRLIEIHDSGSSASECVARDIEVHGGVSNWYVHVDNSPASYRLELGYLGSSGKFYPLVRSNIVTTPEPGASDAIDENWTDVAENFDKIYAMSGGYSTDNNSLELQELFEERLRRPMGAPVVTQFGGGMSPMISNNDTLKFEVDAEMIVYGVTNPDTRVSLRGEPVKIRPDGSFTVRMSLPNQRQVIPVVASAANGVEQRTIVLAVERNTKVMEPLTRETSE